MEKSQPSELPVSPMRRRLVPVGYPIKLLALTAAFVFPCCLVGSHSPAIFTAAFSAPVATHKRNDRLRAQVPVRPASRAGSLSQLFSERADQPPATGTASDDTSSSSSIINNTQMLQLQRSASSSAIAVQELAERTKRIDNLFFLNTSVVAFLGIAALYQLTHVHLEALVALWTYGLGPHPPDMTKLSVAFDLMTRLPVDLIHAYEEAVPLNPIFAKACTSGVAYGLGDFISQIYQGRTLSNLDLPRSFRSGAAGFLVHGPLCHYWLLTMETYLDFGGAWWATGIKVTADLTVWSIFLNAAYSFVIGTLAGRGPQEVWGDIRSTQWPALRSAWRFWPFVHTVSFSHAVPLDLKLLWVDVMEVVWVTILSKVANEDRLERLEKSETTDEVILEVVAAEAVGEMVTDAVDPSVGVELTRKVELSGVDPEEGELSFELPLKVLGACWPLIAMWPVLYAGYQLERTLGLL